MPTELEPGPGTAFGAAADAATAARGVVEDATRSQRDFRTELTLSAREGRQFGRAMTQAFLGLATQGRSAGDVVRQLALSLSRATISAAFKPLEGALSGVFQGLVSGLAGSFASAGGPASGSPAIAPLFTPAGTLAAPALSLTAPALAPGAVPGLPSPSVLQGAAAASGSPLALTFNVTTPDAESFRRSETQLAAMLTRAVGQGQRNL